jgi:nitrogenase molybdenum-iron protein alpha/beta subunit
MEEPAGNGGVNENTAFYIMPTRWFGRWWRDYLREIRETFGAGGVLVDAIHFNNSSIEEIKRLPCHRLNLQGYGRWVNIMKERFGTEYVADRVQYYNSPFRDGIRDFYLDNARLLGVEKEVERIVEKRLGQMEARLKPFRDVFEGKKLAVIKGWSHWGTPYLVLSQIFNLGFDFVYLDLPYDHIYDWNIDRRIIDNHLAALKGVFADYGVKPEIRIEASLDENLEALESLRPDLVITSYDLKWLPHSLGIPAYVPYTFSFYQGIIGAIMAAEEMYKEYSRSIERRPAPIYARGGGHCRYDLQRYPTPCSMMAGMKVWEDVRTCPSITCKLER